MAEKKLDETVAGVPETESDYQAPRVEEVIEREDVEREVAYAGVIGPSQQLN